MERIGSWSSPATNGSPPHGWDGYANGTSRPANSVRPIYLSFYGHTDVAYHLESGTDLDSLIDVEKIVDTGAWVKRTSAFVDDDRRFWCVGQ